VVGLVSEGQVSRFRCSIVVHFMAELFSIFSHVESSLRISQDSESKVKLLFNFLIVFFKMIPSLMGAIEGLIGSEKNGVDVNFLGVFIFQDL